MSTINLEYTRFVKQTSNGSARSKYGYLAMQQELMNQIETTPWKQASCANNLVGLVTNKVTETDEERDQHGAITKPASYTALLKDNFDAFKQGGDANKEDATFCGYGGAVCYRFELPQNYNSNISTIKMKIAASRYLRSGVRVAVELRSSDYPSDDWKVVRGENANAIVTEHEISDVEGVRSWGVLAQRNANTLLQSQAREGEIVFDSTTFPTLGTSTRHKYLFVYLTIEDMTDYWVLYDNNTPRYYSIEGSAMIIGSTFNVTFDGDVSPSTTKWYDSFFITQDMVLPNVKYNPKGGGEEGYIQQYGNFVKGIMRSEMLVMRSIRALNDAGNPSLKDASVSLSILQRFDKFPRQNFFDFDGDNLASYTTDAPLVSNMGIFSGIKAGFTRLGGEWTTTTPFRNEIQVRFRGNGNVSSTLTQGRVASAGSISFTSRFVVAGSGLPLYRRLRMVVTPTIQGDIEMSVNVWKSNSPDVLGIWGIAAASALCSHQEMFTGSSSFVSAELKGDGEKTSQITLNANAKLIGTIPVKSEKKQQTLEIALGEDVLPGEVLILSPKLIRVGFDPSTGTSNDTLPFMLLQPSKIELAK